tara:strand:- start:902 stop:1180 length:279 start_codon:yes stop_codon:yes gene_type:complete
MSHLIINEFSKTLSKINTAITTNKNIDFDSFIHNVDGLFSLVLTQGDIVPMFYIEMINNSFCILSTSYKNKYIQAHKKAVQEFKQAPLCVGY